MICQNIVNNMMRCWQEDFVNSYDADCKSLVTKINFNVLFVDLTLKNVWMHNQFSISNTNNLFIYLPVDNYYIIN